MESRNRYHGIHPYAISTLRHHARRLAKSSGFLPNDVEDIEQEMMLHVHRQLGRHNPARASAETFIARMVGNFAISLHRKVMANDFAEYQTISLHETVQDEDGNTFELADTIPSDCSFWPDRGAIWYEAIENQVDASRLLRQFPPSLRRLARLFMMEQVTTVSRTRGIARQTIYDAVSKMRSLVEGPENKFRHFSSPLRM